VSLLEKDINTLQSAKEIDAKIVELTNVSNGWIDGWKI